MKHLSAISSWVWSLNHQIFTCQVHILDHQHVSTFLEIHSVCTSSQIIINSVDIMTQEECVTYWKLHCWLSAWAPCLEGFYALCRMGRNCQCTWLSTLPVICGQGCTVIKFMLATSVLAGTTSRGAVWWKLIAHLYSVKPIKYIGWLVIGQYNIDSLIVVHVNPIRNSLVYLMWSLYAISMSMFVIFNLIWKFGCQFFCYVLHIHLSLILCLSDQTNENITIEKKIKTNQSTRLVFNFLSGISYRFPWY